MKAITLWQPWATMIALGHKTVETRTHDRFQCLVGQRIAIHAAKKYDKDAFEIMVQHGFSPLHSLLAQGLVPRGAVVATAVVSGGMWGRKNLMSAPLYRQWCRDALCDVAGRFCLHLSKIEPLNPPIPATGHQAIWEWNG